MTSLTDSRLLLRLRRDAADQLRELARHAPDLLQRLPRGVGELGALDDADGRLLHRGHRVLRVRLDRLDDRVDLLRRLARALGEALDFLRHDREAASGLARRRRLDRGVQREDVRLLGDVRDQLDDLADLERGLAEALDPLRRVLDLRADLVHARRSGSAPTARPSRRRPATAARPAPTAPPTARPR